MTSDEFKQARVHMGYSAEALARMWGLTPGAIYHWESGLSPLPRSAELLLAQLFTQPFPGRNLPEPDRCVEGARRGRLEIDFAFPKDPVTGERRLTVTCDCGSTRTFTTATLGVRKQCSKKCPHANRPMPRNVPAPPAPGEESDRLFVFPKVSALPPPPSRKVPPPTPPQASEWEPGLED